VRVKCKGYNCSFWGTSDTGGYCSQCKKNKGKCKKPKCEFFGAPERDGYCTGCYKNQQQISNSSSIYHNPMESNTPSFHEYSSNHFEEKVNTNTKPLDLGDFQGGRWRCVRSVKPGESWHRANDRLNGIEQYDDNDGTFSKTFNDENFTEFLFITGDHSRWLIASKEAVTGSFYTGKKRQITKSSSNNSPSMAVWYRREGCNEDPWISISDHNVADKENGILYGGDNSKQHNGALKKHGGARVYIR